MRRPRFRRRDMIDKARGPRYLLVAISQSVFSREHMNHSNQPVRQTGSWVELATHPRPRTQCLGSCLIVLHRTRCASHRRGVPYSQVGACDPFEKFADLEMCRCHSYSRRTVIHTMHQLAHADQKLIESVASTVSEDLCRGVVWPRHHTSNFRLPL